MNILLYERYDSSSVSLCRVSCVVEFTDNTICPVNSVSLGLLHKLNELAIVVLRHNPSHSTHR